MSNNQNDEDIAISALRDAVFAIEKELGITPSGVYSDTRARFDILEARINNTGSINALNDGYIFSPLFIDNNYYNFNLSISTGYGVPTETRLEGSIYIDGYASLAPPSKLYVRRNNAWITILDQTDLFTPSGDLAGNTASQQVIGLTGASGIVNIYADLLQFSASTTNPKIIQVNTNLHDGYTFTIQAQNAIGAASIGGNLLIKSGSGTLTDGYVSLQAGGIEKVRVTSNKLWNTVGQRINISTISTTPFTITDEYYILSVNTSSIAITVNLPAIPAQGDIYQIKDKSGNSFINNITVSGNGNNIDGFPTYAININYGNAGFIFDGSAWNVL